MISIAAVAGRHTAPAKRGLILGDLVFQKSARLDGLPSCAIQLSINFRILAWQRGGHFLYAGIGGTFVLR